jgi:catechol 2,3-dioxygenase-like lactoylglutathione lyase family enzyme
MPIELNHTIVCARDKRASAAFLADLLGLSVGPDEGPFVPVALDNAATLDFMDRDDDFTMQHYAFLVDGAAFEAAYDRMQDKGVTIFADPFLKQPGQVYVDEDLRGFYFRDLAGHTMELLVQASELSRDFGPVLERT